MKTLERNYRFKSFKRMKTKVQWTNKKRSVNTQRMSGKAVWTILFAERSCIRLNTLSAENTQSRIR